MQDGGDVLSSTKRDGQTENVAYSSTIGELSTHSGWSEIKKEESAESCEAKHDALDFPLDDENDLPIITLRSEVLPSVTLFHSLFSNSSVAKDQLRFFKKAFLAMGIYEIFPTYISPAIQAISLFCLTLPKIPTVTNLFGGAEPFEGLGFLSISGDWALVGTHGPFYTPLNAQVSFKYAIKTPKLL
ncbi:hypothetical protein O181_011674 [Austropuccinia psidii MF-1]|uniref:Uncharacterized protein n=1 Tax=Austropuccinia psidii MF-1 TaxID=1389203 RepID=A0A9Q3BT82_9BASI|nr:hypothetical protein [Austropuccinia psidii MF-1]